MLDDLAELEPHKYDKFLHTNGVPYAFLEVPVSFLNEVIPEGANWSAKEDGQKNVGEYSIGKIYSTDNSKVIITLAAMEAPTYRTPALTYDDLQDWETWLDTKSYTIEDFLTISDRATLLAGGDYPTEDE